MKRRDFLGGLALAGLSLTASSATQIDGLARHDPELAYLALLSQHGLKLLSRWEKPLPEELREALSLFGFEVDTVQRYSKNGNRHIETIFSDHSWALDVYKEEFEGRTLAISPDQAKFEGFLFGYPPCCVHAFVEAPYTENDLPRTDQENLFHWACPGCIVTPYLVRQYQKLWRQVPGPRRS